MSRKLILFAVLLLFACESGEEFTPENPLDPNNPDYVAPEITILSPAEGAVVEASSITFSWMGNEIDMLYRYRLDSVWSEWDLSETITIDYIDEGEHGFAVQSSYVSGDTSAIESIAFTVDAVEGPALMFYPRMQVASQGSSVQFQILAEEVYNVAGAEFTILFDPTELQINSAAAGTAFGDYGEVIFISDIDNSSGSLTIATAVWGENFPSFSGTSDIALIDVQVIKQGNLTISFDGLGMMKDPSNNDITINETVAGLVVVE
jgi:hypothetical protein